MFNFLIDEKNAELVNLASDSRYLTRSTQVLELRAEASELLGAPKILARLENRQDDQPILLIFYQTSGNFQFRKNTSIFMLNQAKIWGN